MSRDYAKQNETKREAVLRVLSDHEWHPHFDLAKVGGVRYSARILELKRLGYVIDSTDVAGSSQGKSYKLYPGHRAPQMKRVKVYLEEKDVRRIIDGKALSMKAYNSLLMALNSFKKNKSKL